MTTTRSIMASWGKTFKYASITANWQHAVNQDDENHNGSNDDDMFYINISIPLGEQRVGAYMRNQGDKTTYGLQNNGSLSKDTHYYISADRDAKTSKIASTVISIAISITLNSAWAAALMAIITATITQPSAGASLHTNMA